MFELKYKITDGDLLKVNKRVMWSYFIPYLAVALLGIGAGVAATVIRPSTSIFVLGIILIVLGAVLLACTVMLAVAPKSFVASALETSDSIERNVKFTETGVTVSTDGQSDITFGYGSMLKARRIGKTELLALYVDKDIVLVVKDTESSASVDEVYEYVSAKIKDSRTLSEPQTAVEPKAAKANEGDDRDGDVAADSKDTVEKSTDNAENVDNESADSAEDKGGEAQPDGGDGKAE